LEGLSGTPEAVQMVVANREALIEEYGEDLVRALSKELKSLTNAAIRVAGKHLVSLGQQDKNDE
jgi:hypothetical protein